MRNFLITSVLPLLIGLFLLFIIPFSAVAESPKLEFEVRPWMTDLVSKAKVSTSTSEGSELDLKSDLNVGDEDFMDWRLTWHTGPNSKLRLSYVQMAFNGDRIISKNLSFSGQTFTAGSRVLTDFDVKLLRLAWIWQFIDKEYIKIGTLVEIKGLWIDTALYAPSTGAKESDNLTTGIPTIGVAINAAPFDFINVFGEISGLYIDERRYGYTYDAETGIKIIPFNHVSITGGYRILEINAEDAPDYAKFKLQGPFIGVILEF